MRSDTLTLAALAVLAAATSACQSTSPSKASATKLAASASTTAVGGISGAGGQATMRCIVEATGHLRDCKIVSENPAGHGLGAATLKAAHLFKVKPPTSNGRPVEGSIAIPIKWRLQDKAPGNTTGGEGGHSTMPPTNTTQAPN